MDIITNRAQQDRALDILSGKPFGEIHWELSDLENALDLTNRPITNENLVLLAMTLSDEKTHDRLIDAMVEAGWDYIYNLIYNTIPMEED